MFCFSSFRATPSRLQPLFGARTLSSVRADSNQEPVMWPPSALPHFVDLLDDIEKIFGLLISKPRLETESKKRCQWLRARVGWLVLSCLTSADWNEIGYCCEQFGESFASPCHHRFRRHCDDPLRLVVLDSLTPSCRRICAPARGHTTAGEADIF